MKIHFTKLHGLGNDFVFIDNRAQDVSLSAGDVRLLCDRHIGVGADGVMLLEPPYRDGSDYSWTFINADGSVAEMCGNGIRCAARFIEHIGALEGSVDSLTIDTLAGPISVSLNRSSCGSSIESFAVDMGSPRTAAADIPTTLAPTGTFTFGGSTMPVVVDVPLTVLDREYLVTAVSMGNPHAVMWLDPSEGPLSEFRLHEVGPAIQTSPAFPASVNVEFIVVDSDSHISMRVWERGVGETQACGTGACAVAFAAYIKGLVSDAVTVSLPGGDLDIRIDEAGNTIWMTGPAVTVFDGTVVTSG